MFPLPKRPGPYIVAVLVIVLFILAAWLDYALNSPEVQEAIRKHKQKQKTTVTPLDAP